MAIGDIFQVTAVGKLAGQLTNMTMNYRQTAGGSLGPPALGLGDTCATTWITDLLLWQSSAYTHEYTISSKINPLPREASFISVTAAGAGGGGAAAAPPSCAATVTKLTVLAGTRYRGRIFVPGVPLLGVTDGALTGATVIALNAATIQLFAPLTDLNGNTFQPVIFHRDSGTSTDMIGRSAKAVLRSQRRREVGVGQ